MTERDILYRADGYLTVFLSLSLTVILGFYFVLMEGAALNSGQFQTEIITDIAAGSALGEYNRELLSQYDLFFIDTSYGSFTPDLSNTQKHIEEYLEKNLTPTGVIGVNNIRNFVGLDIEEVTVDSARYSTQLNGAPVKEQIYAYFSADPLEEGFDEVLAMADNFQGFSLESGEWQERRDACEQALSEAEPVTVINDEGEEETAEIENPAAPVLSFRATPVLNQVIRDYGGISAAAALSNRLSERGVILHETVSPENTHEYPEADALMLDEYIMEKCGRYGSTKEGSHLSYEVEYIIAGEDSDRKNLETIARRLLIIREAANCIHIFSDEGKTSQAKAIASVLACCLLNPELVDIITPVILFGWAYVESVKDVSSLLAGGKVPLIKDASSWKTPITCILAPSLYTSADTGGSGMSYADYLRIFLYMNGMSGKTLRLFDIIEMDIRETDGNSFFQMDQCLDAFRLQVKTSDRYGHEHEAKISASYN